MAFARYYLNLVNDAWMQADSTIFMGLSDPDCEICDWWVEHADDLRNSNERASAQVVTIGAFKKSTRTAASNEEVFRVDCVQQKHHTVHLFGATSDPVKRKRMSPDVWVVWRHNEWYFRGWYLED